MLYQHNSPYVYIIYSHKHLLCFGNAIYYMYVCFFVYPIKQHPMIFQKVQSQQHPSNCITNYTARLLDGQYSAYSSQVQPVFVQHSAVIEPDPCCIPLPDDTRRRPRLERSIWVAVSRSSQGNESKMLRIFHDISKSSHLNSLDHLTVFLFHCMRIVQLSGSCSSTASLQSINVIVTSPKQMPDQFFATPRVALVVPHLFPIRT